MSTQDTLWTPRGKARKFTWLSQNMTKGSPGRLVQEPALKTIVIRALVVPNPAFSTRLDEIKNFHAEVRSGHVTLR